MDSLRDSEDSCVETPAKLQKTPAKFIKYLVFDLDQTLVELFKPNGHIIPVGAYIRVLLNRMGYKITATTNLEEVVFDTPYDLKTVEYIAEIMDTIIYNGGKGGSLVNGLFNSEKVSLFGNLKDETFRNQIKYLEPLAQQLFKILPIQNKTLAYVFAICKDTLSDEERLFFNECSRVMMPQQNKEKFQKIIDALEKINVHNSNPQNTTHILCCMFSAGTGYMNDFLDQSGIGEFMQFAIDFQSENEFRKAFSTKDANGTYQHVKCKPDHATFATVDNLISKSLWVLGYPPDIPVTAIMIDDNVKVCEEVSKLKSTHKWIAKQITKISSEETVSQTHLEIAEFINEILSTCE